MCVRALLASLSLLGVAWADLPPNQQAAVDRYRQLLLEKPLHPSALERLWRIYSAAGETDALVASFSARDTRLTPQEHLLAARIFLRSGSAEQAVELLESESADESPEREVILAEAYSEIGRPEDAAEAFQSAAADAEPITAARRLTAAARQYAKAGLPARSLVTWAQAGKLRPPSPADALDLAARLSAAGAEDEAFEVLDSAARSGPPEARLALLEKKAELAGKNGNLPAAIEATEAQLALLGPEHWKRQKAEADLIRLHKSAGTLPQLRDEWEAALSAFPRDPTRLRRLAQLARAEHRAIEEAELLERLFAVDPSDEKALERLVNLHVRLGDWERAAETLDRLRKASPQDPRLLIWRAVIAVRLARPARAEELIREYLEVTDPPDYPGALAFFRQHGLEESLIAALRQQLANDPHALDAAVELATIHLQKGETATALELLETTTPSETTQDAQAAWFSRIARTLDDFNLSEASLYWARRASEANPDDENALLALADKLANQNFHEQARARLEDVIEKTDSPELRSAADRRLHALLQSAPQSDEPGSNTNGWIQNLQTRNRNPTSRPGTSQAVRDYLAQLREQTTEADSVAPFLRLAEWLDLTGETNGAANTLQRALDRFPNAREPRLKLIELRTREGMLADATKELEALIELTEGEEQADLLRRLARLQLERGDHEPALQTLRSLMEADPTAADRHVDLAIALQTTDRWFEALQSWKEAYKTAAPARRTEIIRSMLPGFDRIGAHNDAEAFLFDAAAQETNPDRKLQIYQAVARYEIDHGRVDAARRLLENLPPDEANSLGARAARIAIEPVGSKERTRLLAQLAQESGRAAELAAEIAGASGENELAAEVRADKVLAGVSSSPAAWAELANSREQAGEIDAAAEVWLQASNVHSQDRNLLSNAADFFRRNGRWRDELNALRQHPYTSETSPERWLRTAILEDRAGNPEAAADAATEVIRSTPALNADSLVLANTVPHDRKREAANLAFRIAKGFHDQQTLAISRALTQSPDKKDTASMRVEALQLLATTSDGEGLTADLELSETDRAFLDLARGDPASARDSLAGAIDSDRATDVPQFNWLLAAIAAEDYGAIREWIDQKREFQPARAELLNLALSLTLAHTSPPENRLAEKLAIPMASTLPGVGWRLAHVLADHGYYHAAARGGLRAFNESDILRKPGHAILLAKWLTISGNRPAARTVLSRVSGDGNHGFQDPAIAASRLLWRISNEEEQAELLDSFDDTSIAGNPGIRLAQAAIWNEMAGNHETADAAIADWTTFAALGSSRIATDGNPFSQRIRTSISELESFGLGRLALSLANAAAEQDTLSLLAAAEVDREWPRELRAIALRLAVELGSTETGLFLVRDLAPEPADIPHLTNTLRILSERGHLRTSLLLAEQILDVNPNDLPTRQIAVHLARKLGMQEKAADLLTEWYTRMKETRADREQLAAIQRQLISTHREAGRIDKALELIAPSDELPIDRADQLLRNELLATAGEFAQLEKHLRKYANSGDSLLGGEKIELAEFLSETGREKEALELTENIPTSNEIMAQAAMIARLRASLLLHNSDEVTRILKEMAEIGDPTRVRIVAQLLDESGQSEAIPEFLANAIVQNQSAADLIYIAALLFAEHSAASSSALLEEALRSVIAASESSERNLTYFTSSVAELPEHPADPALNQLLASHWREGKGPVWVGSLLAERLARIDRNDAAAETIGELLALPNLDPEVLTSLAARLEQIARHDLTEPLWDRVLETRRNHLTPLVRAARNLWLQGKRYAALETLHQARIAPLWHPEAALEMGRFFVSVDRPETAARYLERGGDYDHFNTENLIRSQIVDRLAAGGRWDELERELSRPGEKSLPGFGEATAQLLHAREKLATLDASTRPFELVGPALTAFQVESANLLIDDAEPELSYRWLRATADKPYQSEVLEPLARLTPNPTEELAAIWEHVLAVDHRRESRLLGSQFYTEWSRKTDDPNRKMRLLERARELSPSNPEAALELSSLLLESGDQVAASNVLHEADHAKLTIPERRKLRAALQKIEASP